MGTVIVALDNAWSAELASARHSFGLADGNQRGSHHAFPIQHDAVLPQVLVQPPFDLPRHLRAHTWGLLLFLGLTK